MAQEPVKSDAPDQGAAPQPEPRKPLAQVAKEFFGDDFHGKPPPEEPKKPVSPDTEEEVEIEEPEIEGADVEEQQDQEPLIVPGEQPDQQTAEGEEEPFQTVHELVEHLEADPAWFDGLRVNVNVHGQTSQVPLRDLVANYQTNQAADERLAKTKAKVEQSEQELQQRNAVLNQKYAEAEKLIELGEQQLTRDFTAIDWNKLQAEDPAMWAAQRQAFGERNGQIQQLKAGLQYSLQSAQTQRNAELEQKVNALKQEEHQLMLAAMPKVDKEWGDPNRVQAKKAELANYLLKQGFSQQDLDGAADHRLIVVAAKARLWDESQSKVALTQKRLKNVPRVLKPGAKKEPAVINMEKVRKAQTKLKSTGHIDDALAVLRARRRG